MKHISSFIGNVGDVLSNAGFSNYLEANNGHISERIEIRNFYRNVPQHSRRNFDDVFNECQQSGEGLVIGGGGFLDYWVDQSRTATTIDVNLALVAETDFKLIITSIGSFPHKYVSPENRARFIEFMSVLTQRKNTFVMLRNDGSADELKTILPENVFKKLYLGADNAYLLEPVLHKYTAKKAPNQLGDYVVFNVAPDQLLMDSKFRGEIDYEHFKKQILQTIRYVIQVLNKKVVLVPHLVSDVKFYIELCESLDDLMVRESVTLFTYSGQYNALQDYFDVYSNSSANVCTRLHANILSAMLNKKTVSLCVLDRVRAVAQQHQNLNAVTEFDGNFSDQISEYLLKSHLSENTSNLYRLLDTFYSRVL